MIICKIRQNQQNNFKRWHPICFCFYRKLYSILQGEKTAFYLLQLLDAFLFDGATYSVCQWF